MSKKIEVHKSHRNEWKSKRDFQNLLEEMNMFLPFEWAVRDYGIDTQVQITRPIKNSDSLRPDCIYFLVQLKSIEKIKIVNLEIAFSIPVKKVIQWYSSTQPVMFVLNDLNGKSFYSIWIDEKLINKLDTVKANWVNQEKITLKIPVQNNFNNYSSDMVRDYVYEWKRPLYKIIKSGLYFELKDECISNLKDYELITKTFHFDSINNDVRIAKNQIEQAIYKIAITGPSRVGKSTLINAFLKRNISPTGLFQTTGVPIQILPGKKDSIDIIFRGGKSETREFSLETITEFASQEHNLDNKKDVSLVIINLVNKQLEQGLSLFDIPGLDDPDDDIVNYTFNTVSKANAILYLIDASPFENGGYIFKNEYKKHILELGQSLDKIFLVFNKINALTGNKLELLQNRVEMDLKKLGLFEKVSNKIYFISAEDSLSMRLHNSDGIDTVQKLEEEIWEYLLKENKMGLINLSVVNKELIQSSNNFEDLLKIRLLDNQQLGKLEIAINEVKGKIPELKKLYQLREEDFKKGVKNSLENKKNNFLIRLERFLKSFSINTELPNKVSMRNYLLQGAHASLEEANKEYMHQINLLKDMIDQWIEYNLEQVREIIQGDSEQKIIDFSEIDNFEMPSVDLSNAFGVGLFAGIIGLVLNPPAALIAAISGFFGNILLSASERRAKRIAKIMERARFQYDRLFDKITDAYMNLIKEHSRLILGYANNKIHLYFADVQTQMDKLGNKISDDEIIQYQNAFNEIKKVRNSISKLNVDINTWYCAF